MTNQQRPLEALAVPAVTVGNYYVGAIADRTAIIGESDKTNNSLAGSPTTISYGPDLVVSSVTPPATATTGTQVTIPVTVTNQGIGASGASYVGLYLSTDSTITPSKTYLGQALISALAVGGQQTVNVTVTVPAVTVGNYYIGAIADRTNIIKESDETNNSLVGSVTTLATVPIW